jgi:hypothetical protein
VIRVDDIGKAQARGVRRLPALVVDGTIRSEGKSLTAGEIKVLLQEGGIERIKKSRDFIISPHPDPLLSRRGG